MLRLRQVGVVLGAAWVSAWTARALFDWILGLDDTLVVILSVLFSVLGGLSSIGAARELEPWTLWDTRDAYLGWVTFFGIVAVIACLFIPMPWGGIAAGVVAAGTIVVLRRAPRVPLEERRPQEPAG